MMKIKNRKEQKDSDKETTIVQEILGFSKDLLISFMLVFLVIHFVARPVQVIGSSMYPTLQNGAYGFSNVLSSKLDCYERFDIAIIYLEEKDEYLVKRIIGMPGETVQYIDNQLYINGERYEETFLNEAYTASYDRFTEDFGPITLSDDEYFCLGDNRQHSTDSRYYGPFKKDLIVAKGIAVFWPLRQMGVYTW